MNDWHVMVFIAGPLDSLVNLGALDGRDSGKGINVDGARGRGEDQFGVGGERVVQTASETM